MSCFNLLDRSAWPAQCHITWIFIPASKYKTCFQISPLPPGTEIFHSFPVMNPQSHCPILCLISLFIILCRTHSAHHWQKITLDLQSPMGGSRNMFVWCHREEMAANERHLFLRSASIISTQHKPNLWTSGKTKCIFSSPENNTCSFLAFQQQYFLSILSSSRTWIFPLSHQILKENNKPQRGCYFSLWHWKHMSSHWQLMFCEYTCQCGVCDLAPLCERYYPPTQISPCEEKTYLWSRLRSGNVGWRERAPGKTRRNLVASPSQMRKSEIHVCINSQEQMLFSVGTRDSQMCKQILKQLTKTTVN